MKTLNNAMEVFGVITITLNPAIDRTVVIPKFTVGAVNRAESSTDAAGGKGVNVAAALSDSGLRVAATGFLGAENCAPFQSLLAAKGISYAFVHLPGRTRMGIKVVDPTRGETTDINFPGLSPTAADLAVFHSRLAGLHAPWVALAGSLPPGVDGNFYRDLIKVLKARGSRVALDTSGDALEAAMSAAPTIMKPNIHELETLVGKRLCNPKQVVAAARRLVEDGVELVAVSMGSEGACFVTAHEAVLTRPPRVEVASTVGAGDAMVAGLISAQLLEKSVCGCAVIATAFSVHAVTRKNASTPFDANAIGALAKTIEAVSIEQPMQL